MKKICFYGAGAVGCTLAVRFSDVADVSLIARGDNLAALQANGLTCNTPKWSKNYQFTYSDDIATLPAQDIIFLTTKSHQLPTIAQNIAQILQDETIIIPMCNGIPWWFTNNMDIFEDFNLQAVDPTAILQKSIPTHNIIGGLTYGGMKLESPAVVNTMTPPKVIFGELDGRNSQRIEELDALAQQAKFKDPTTDNIRGAILTKLCWNITFNILSVIYELDSGSLAKDKTIGHRVKKMIAEMEILSKKINISMQLTTQDHINIAKTLDKFKPSMLQDYENGNRLETASIIDSIMEMANFLNLSLPEIALAQEEIYKKIGK